MLSKRYAVVVLVMLGALTILGQAKESWLPGDWKLRFEEHSFEYTLTVYLSDDEKLAGVLRRADIKEQLMLELDPNGRLIIRPLDEDKIWYLECWPTDKRYLEGIFIGEKITEWQATKLR